MLAMGLAMRRLMRHGLQASARPFTTAVGGASLKNMPSRPKPPPDSEIEESYLKGSGPGGQKINKTNSAVQLKHIPTGIVVKSQATRSRSQNRKHAREILAQRLDDLVNGDESRSAVVGGVRKKRADSAAKKSRRKYRKLEEEKQKGQGEEEAEDKVDEDLHEKGASGQESGEGIPGEGQRPLGERGEELSGQGNGTRGGPGPSTSGRQ